MTFYWLCDYISSSSLTNSKEILNQINSNDELKNWQINIFNRVQSFILFYRNIFGFIPFFIHSRPPFHSGPFHSIPSIPFIPFHSFHSGVGLHMSEKTSLGLKDSVISQNKIVHSAVDKIRL